MSSVDSCGWLMIQESGCRRLQSHLRINRYPPQKVIRAFDAASHRCTGPKTNSTHIHRSSGTARLQTWQRATPEAEHRDNFSTTLVKMTTTKSILEQAAPSLVSSSVEYEAKHRLVFLCLNLNSSLKFIHGSSDNNYYTNQAETFSEKIKRG